MYISFYGTIILTNLLIIDIDYEIDWITYLPPFEYFLHNIKFIFLFMIPIVGAIYFFISFIYSALYFGLYFSISDSPEIIVLIHSVFEITAFSLSVYLSIYYKTWKTNTKKIFYYLPIMVFLLIVAAIIESQITNFL